MNNYDGYVGYVDPMTGFVYRIVYDDAGNQIGSVRLFDSGGADPSSDVRQKAQEARQRGIEALNAWRNPTHTAQQAPANNDGLDAYERSVKNLNAWRDQ